MAEPISIGGQTFIKTSDGWIDRKTKIPADKGLLNLLNSLQSDGPSPKLRVKIDRNREPISFAGTKYVYDLNQQGWIDQKTRVKVHENLQKILNDISKPMAAPSTMGLIGQAGISQVREKPAVSGSGIIPIRKEINTPIVSMVEKLATIDGYLKQRLDNQKKIQKGEIQALREAAVESQPDATPITQVKEGEEKKSNAGALLAVAGVATIIASQFEPVQEAFKTVVDGVGSVFGYVTDFVKIMADGLGSLIGGDAAAPVSTAAATPVAAPAPTPNAVPAPSQPNVVETPSVPESQDTPGITPSVPTPPATPDVAQPSRPSLMSSMAGGALLGGVFGSVVRRTGVGAAVGAAVGAYNYFSGGSQTTGAPMAQPASTSSPQSDAQPTTAGQKTADATPEPASSGKVVQTSHSATGSGWTVKGALDYKGRPVVFSKEGAEAFAKMMEDSGGIVKPSDVHSSKRSVSQNNAVDGAKNSPHLRGVAMDIHGESANWIRANGSKYGWNPHDYKGTHGGHFVFGGGSQGLSPDDGAPGFSGNAGGIAGMVGSAFDIGKEALNAIGSLFATAFGEGEYDVRDLSGVSKSSSAITKAAIEKNTAIAEERSAKDGPKVSLPAPANINKNPQSKAIENAPTPGDHASVDFYLTRFGFGKTDYSQRAA